MLHLEHNGSLILPPILISVFYFSTSWIKKLLFITLHSHSKKQLNPWRPAGGLEGRLSRCGGDLLSASVDLHLHCLSSWRFNKLPPGDLFSRLSTSFLLGEGSFSYFYVLTCFLFVWFVCECGVCVVHAHGWAHGGRRTSVVLSVTLLCLSLALVSHWTWSLDCIH